MEKFNIADLVNLKSEENNR